MSKQMKPSERIKIQVSKVFDKWLNSLNNNSGNIYSNPSKYTEEKYHEFLIQGILDYLDEQYEKERSSDEEI